MTTAPTPSHVERLARGLEEGFCGHAAWLQPAAAELRRLQAENERLLGQVHKLEMDALDLASENSILKRQDSELKARKPLPPADMTPVQHVNALVGDGLTAQKVEAICEREPYDVTGVVLSLPDGRACIVNQSAVRWFHGERDFWELMHGWQS